MLTKRNHTLIGANKTVKKVATVALSALILSAGAIAPSAFANGPLIDVTVSVKFKMSDLEAKEGTQKVYDKLKRKAVSSCMSDRAALRYLDQTVSECADNLVEQFVANAEVPKLSAFHRTQLANAGTVLLASNK